MLFGSYEGLFNDYESLFDGFGGVPLDLLQSVYARLTSRTNWDVYALRMPQKATYPCLVYTLVDTQYGANLEGSDTTATTRLSFHLWSHSFADCLAMEKDLRNALQGFQGLLADDGVVVLSCFPEGKYTDYEQPENATDQGLHHFVVDYKLLYRVDRNTFTWAAGPTESSGTVEASLVAELGALGIPVFAGHRPQKAVLPSYSFAVKSLEQGRVLEGAGGWGRAKIELTAYAADLATATFYAEEARLRLAGLFGEWFGVYVYSCLVESRTNEFVRLENNSDQGTYLDTLDVAILYQELVPT